MKRCSACQRYKSESKFFSNAAMRDGLSNQCKECHTISTQRWARANPEKVKQIGKENKTKQRKRDGIRKTRQKWSDWYANAADHRRKYIRDRYNPIQRSAQNKLNKAILYGRVIRPKQCSQCGKHCKPDAHHPDYSKPFEVIWLCRKCHRLLQNSGK